MKIAIISKLNHIRKIYISNYQNFPAKRRQTQAPLYTVAVFKINTGFDRPWILDPQVDFRITALYCILLRNLLSIHLFEPQISTSEYSWKTCLESSVILVVQGTNRETSIQPELSPHTTVNHN